VLSSKGNVLSEEMGHGGKGGKGVYSMVPSRFGGGKPKDGEFSHELVMKDRARMGEAPSHSGSPPNESFRRENLAAKNGVSRKLFRAGVSAKTARRGRRGDVIRKKATL